MPIQYALTWPERAAAPVPKIDWNDARMWEFYPPDHAKFPLLGLAYEAQSSGGSATCILNAADEVAVEAFLQGRIDFSGIPNIIRDVVSATEVGKLESISQVLKADSEARVIARERIEQLGEKPAGVPSLSTATRVE